MTHTHRLVAAFVAALTTGAATRPAAQSRTAVDDLKAALMEADRGFNRAVADRSLSRFLSFVAEDASFESAAGRGRDAVAKAWQPFFEPDGPAISWVPTRAGVLVGGDVGYTVGTWERRTPAPDGRRIVSRGEYLTVWRKQSDGAWRAVFDTGSTRPPEGAINGRGAFPARGAVRRGRDTRP